MKKFISWRRVSTQKQGRSGLGLEAQREIIRYFVEREQGEIVADYTEVYTGKDLQGCKELRKAMTHAKEVGAVLVIAKSDRFRNTQEALQIYDDMGEGNIMFCDLPHTDKFTLTLFFALAEREALIISIRTKQALRAKAARGETWVRNTDMSAAVQASAKAMTDRAIHYAFEGDLPKYCKARYEQGWAFMDILSDAQKMYDIDPVRYGTRKGCRLNKAQLHRWMCVWRDVGRAVVPDNDRRAGVQRPER